jgi:hypothetical protein
MADSKHKEYITEELGITNIDKKLKLNCVTLTHEQTMPTERPPLVGKVSANFCV